MTKTIYEIIREQTSERIELPEELPEEKRLSKEAIAKEFELDSEARIIEYFVYLDKLKRHDVPSSPVDIKKFYTTQATEFLFSQIRVPTSSLR